MSGKKFKVTKSTRVAKTLSMVSENNNASTKDEYKFNSECDDYVPYDDGWGGFEPDNSRYTGEHKSDGDWECMGF